MRGVKGIVHGQVKGRIELRREFCPAAAARCASTAVRGGCTDSRWRRTREGPAAGREQESTSMPCVEAAHRCGFVMSPTQPSVVDVPATGTGVRAQLEDMYQVVLFNDDHNSMEHVVDCLMKTFNHPIELAIKIMLEAHQKGKAIAEVESETPAKLHRDQLISFGLTAVAERI
jgi:ATP-dependent Clp protease adaptor protein ClpS